MRRITVAVALIAVMVGAAALPAGAVAAHRLPLTADCLDRGRLTFDIIEGEGSLVGFECETGRPVVFYGVEGVFIYEVSVDGVPADSVEFPEAFLKGKGKGLELTTCQADADVPIEKNTLPLTDETAALIFAEFGIELEPDAGENVTVIGTFDGTLLVQFPRR